MFSGKLNDDDDYDGVPEAKLLRLSCRSSLLIAQRQTLPCIFKYLNFIASGLGTANGLARMVCSMCVRVF